ncbi:hypothetical protein [Kribbella kalugense]|uniref:Uncharacterized protein n=1 Tax=Kribbella kalugense TaxID=2512221 RepID=A0A4R7ZA40_9ACTN|nr:hypothetical protein [Kribbella kalugense]TDW14323.1 hypothetical protein EV650_7911 [Kribbella kalugense]
MAAAEFLTDVVRGRIELLQLLDEGAYDAVVERGDQLTGAIVDHLQTTTDPTSAGALPLQLQLGALTADVALARVGLGRLDELRPALDEVQTGFSWLRDQADVGLYFDGAVCCHGKTSLDGLCLKRPPCGECS